MVNQITGRIDAIKPTETREHNGKTYYERTIILDATRHDQYTGEPMYPNFPAFTFSGEDKCSALYDFTTGEVVTISFDIKGAKYTDKNTGEEKVFNRVQGFKIERRNANSAPDQTSAQAPATSAPVNDLPWEA